MMPIFGRIPLIALLTLLGVLGLGTRADAEPLTCPDGRTTVAAEDGALATRVCQVSSRSLERLTACNLSQTETVNIRVLTGVEDTRPGCAGRFICHEGRIEILHPDVLAQRRNPDNGFANLPILDLFYSILTHEMTHALIYQTLGGVRGTVAENEYIAYAMQLDALPADLRDTVIAPHLTEDEVTLAELNRFILQMSPSRFAARAWQHFARPENGCGFVGQILDGSVRFGLSLP